MIMITTLTMNPCIDYSILVEKLIPGGTNRVISARRDGAGKGINVASVFCNLGGTACCVFPDFAQNGELVRESVVRKDILARAIPAEGTLRTNVKVLEIPTQTYTEFNEKGHPLTEETVAALKNAVREQREQSSLIVLSGSLPKGLSADFYADFLAELQGCRVILDTSGEALTKGIEARPFLIKPNIDEFSALTGKTYQDLSQIVADAKGYIARGITYICISLGKDGALMISAEETWYAPGLELQVKGAQGAGDSVVAGICKALEENADVETMLRYGVAAASATVEQEGTGLCDKKGFDRMLSKIKCQKLPVWN